MEKIYAFLSAYNIVENVLFSAGPLASLYAANKGIKSYLRHDIGTSVIIAAVLLVKPEWLFSYMLNSPLKPFHYFLCSLYACNLINSVSSTFYLLNSQDDAVHYGHFWSKVISSSLIVIDNIFSYNEGIHWNYKVLCLSASYFAFTAMISAFYLSKIERPRGSNPFQDLANNLAKLEHVFLLAVGLSIYAFPDSFVNGLTIPNESYRSLVRVSGAFIFSFGYESFCMKEFIYLRDKKKFMQSRILASMIQFTFLLAGFYYYDVFTSKITFYTFTAVNLAHTVLVYYGFRVTPIDPLQQVKSG